MTTAKSSVLYPNPPDLKFNLDYYLKTHMPLVEKHWGPLGLKSWEIIQYDAGPDSQTPQFCIEALLVWESEDAVVTATSSDSEAAKIIFGDVPKFTNVSPTFVRGKSVGSNSI